MSLHQPSIWFLLALVVLPLLWWRWMSSRGRATIAFSSVAPLAAAGTSWTVRLRWLPAALRTATLGLVIIALARPQKADAHTRTYAEGIAIQLIVDRSGSMEAPDFEIDRRPASRLAAVKQVVKDFITGGDDLSGRPDDLIGVITFASFADSISPPTLDHDHLVGVIDQVRVATQQEGSGTAIGDALALGVERLNSLSDRPDLLGRSAIKSKIIILLTDGENNQGEIDPQTAAEMAAALGIKVYTIGAGSENSMIRVPVTDPFTGRQMVQTVRVSIDERALRAIADATSGEYFRATDTESLRRIYARIDELEKTRIEQHRYTNFHEFAVQPLHLGGVLVPPVLVFAFILLAAELLLRHTVFRRAC